MVEENEECEYCECQGCCGTRLHYANELCADCGGCKLNQCECEWNNISGNKKS